MAYPGIHSKDDDIINHPSVIDHGGKS